MTTPHAPIRPDKYRPAIATHLYLLFGPLVWAAHLMLIYGQQSIVCALVATPPSPILLGFDAVQIVILAATGAGLAAVGLAALAMPQPGVPSGSGELSNFLAAAMRLLVLLSAFGIAAAGAVALLLPSCPALR